MAFDVPRVWHAWVSLQTLGKGRPFILPFYQPSGQLHYSRPSCSQLTLPTLAWDMGGTATVGLGAQTSPQGHMSKPQTPPSPRF